MTSKFLRDLAERVVATYLQAFAGLLIAGWSDAVNVGTVRAAAVAAIPAALSALKGLVAQRFGDPDSAALVADYDPHTVD